MQNIGGKYIMAPNQIIGGAMAPLPPPLSRPHGSDVYFGVSNVWSGLIEKFWIEVVEDVINFCEWSRIFKDAGVSLQLRTNHTVHHPH